MVRDGCNRARSDGGRLWGAYLGGLLGIALAVTCAPDIEPWLRPPARRAVLFAGLPSYAPLAEVEKRLPLGRHRTDKKHHGRSRGCLSRTFRYRVHIVTVPETSHLGCAGKLRLTFLNDKLVKTRFQPIRGQVYLERLVARTPLSLPPTGHGPKMRLAGAPLHTRVEVRSNANRMRITWSDVRLLKAYWEVQSRGSSRYMK